MASEKDQTASLAFKCPNITAVEHIFVGMAVVVKPVIDTEEDLDLQQDIDHVDGMAYDMETQKVADSEQLICTGTDSKVPEVKLVDLGEFPILY